MFHRKSFPKCSLNYIKISLKNNAPIEIKMKNY